MRLPASGLPLLLENEKVRFVEQGWWADGHESRPQVPRTISVRRRSRE
jgi:hypothetical protein